MLSQVLSYRPRTDALNLIALITALALALLLCGGQPITVFAWSIVVLTSVILIHLWIRRSQFALWHTLVLIGLMGYIILGYGFANLTLRTGGAPIAIGHALMFSALGLAVLKRGAVFVQALKEPATVSIFVLVLLSALHLIFDVPRYGFYAVRDSSVFLEGVFLLLGLLWAVEKQMVVALARWLLIIFILNFLYCLSLPWAAWISAHSPTSGLFLSVPLFGAYSENSLYLLAGAFFCLGPARHLIRWPRWIFLTLAVGQLFGLAIFQQRTLYVAAPLGFLFLILVGEIGYSVKAMSALFVSGLIILVLTSFVGLELKGRVGPVNLDFIERHFESLSLKPGTPALGSLYDREKWYGQVWNQVQSSEQTLVVGLGFGKPLINFRGVHGVVVRQPHNTHLSVLGRLGLLGAAFWAVFHLSIMARLLQGLRNRRQSDPMLSDLVPWLFLFYMFSMMVTSVQPYLEFSFGAIPFYFIMGLALGVIRWHVHGRDPAGETVRLSPIYGAFPRSQERGQQCG